MRYACITVLTLQMRLRGKKLAQKLAGSWVNCNLLFSFSDKLKKLPRLMLGSAKYMAEMLGLRSAMELRAPRARTSNWRRGFNGQNKE